MNDMPTEEDGAERAAARIASLLPALREAGIETVTIEYSGSYGEAGFCISPEELPKKISRILAELFPSILPAGWAADDGGFGTIAIDTTRGELTIDHNSRYSDEKEECWTTPITPDGAPDPVATLHDLLGPLREAGITRVHIHYDGCENGGTIEHVKPPTIPENLRQRLEKIAFDLPPDGWDMNDGGHGVIDIDKEHLAVDHKWRTIETESTWDSYQLF
jgi:hypothetical protein